MFYYALCFFHLAVTRLKPNSIYWLKCQSIYRLVHFRLLFVSNKVIAYYLLSYKPYLILFFLRVTEVFPFLANVVISAVSKKYFAKISFPRNTMNVDQPFYPSIYNIMKPFFLEEICKKCFIYNTVIKKIISLIHLISYSYRLQIHGKQTTDFIDCKIMHFLPNMLRFK